jgi:hypothetical protein
MHGPISEIGSVIDALPDEFVLHSDDTLIGAWILEDGVLTVPASLYDKIVSEPTYETYELN